MKKEKKTFIREKSLLYLRCIYFSVFIFSLYLYVFCNAMIPLYIFTGDTAFEMLTAKYKKKNIPLLSDVNS